MSDERVWRHGGGDRGRTALFPGEASLGPLRRLLETKASIQAPVVFDRSGAAYLADMAGGVYACRADAGLLWRAQVPGGVAAAPALSEDDQSLFVGTLAGYVCRLETLSGRERWRTLLPTDSDPRVVADLLFLREEGWIAASSWGGRLTALDATTGAPARSWDAGLYPSAPAAADPRGRIWFLRTRDPAGLELVLAEPHGGEQTVLRTPAGPRGARRLRAIAPPVADARRNRLWHIANAGPACRLIAVDLETGRKKVEIAWDAAVTAGAALLPDGGLAIADLAGRAAALDSAGGVRWKADLGADYLLAGLAADRAGRVFCVDPLGAVWRFSPSGEKLKVGETRRALLARPSFDPAGRLWIPSTDRGVCFLGTS